MLEEEWERVLAELDTLRRDIAREVSSAARRLEAAPENLKYVALNIEPAAWGSLGILLKAAGRLSLNRQPRRSLDKSVVKTSFHG